MSRTWTRRRITSLLPASGPRLSRATSSAALLFALLLPSCHGSNSNENHIKEITATLTIDPFPGTPDPAVYLFKAPKDPKFPFLEIVEVRLYTTSPVSFDSMNFEFHFDPSRVQVGLVFEVNPSVLGDCHSGAACVPFCLSNATDANSTGEFFLGISKNPGPNCPSANLSSETTLVKFGLVAATTIDPPGSPIELISGPGHGDCEILQGLDDVLVGGLPIPCVGGNARMTATR